MSDASKRPRGQETVDPGLVTEAPETTPPRPEPQRPEITADGIATTEAAPGAASPADGDGPELDIDPNTVAWIIVKAREFDMKEPATAETDDDDGDNPLGVLEDRADDPTDIELRNWISDLDDDAQAELVALMWLGRGDDEEIGGFPELVREARRRQMHGRRTAGYLLGTPRLGDYLEEGLEKLGIDTTELEGSLR